MLRQNDPVLRHVDKFWEYVEKMDGFRMRCKFCGHEFSLSTSILRIKFHLAGGKGYGVRICGQVPQDVQDAALAALNGPPNKKHKAGAGSTNKEVTNAISSLAQQQNNEMMMAHQREGHSLKDWKASINLYVDAGRIQAEEEEDVLKNSGRLVQPDEGGSSSGGLKHNQGETRGTPLLTGSTKLVGRAFEENRNVIWSWLTDDEVSTIGIYGMGGVGKTTMLKHIYNELLQTPDISHHVYWVTVSRDFSIHKLQNKIAKHIILFFSSEEEELEHRAAKLSQELMKKQRWILILDDLWNSFNPHEVGIPVPLKGCKLIMTTQSEAICQQMNSRNNVKVYPLSNEEAWTLFMKELGHDRILSPQVQRIARDITRECAGFPLGIKTVAGTMKGVDDMHEWSDALEDLKQSKVPQDKVEEEVFQILRFSYNHLSDEALQQCFLYCGLYPEDFEISREDLIDYLIDKGVVKGHKSREAEINKGHTMLDRLHKACLLERLHGGNYVKMHGLIRDMAIQILEENSRAIVKAGAQLKELPDVEEWGEKLSSVSLMHNQIEEICSWHSPRSPNLTILLLCDNYGLRFIDELFFEQLHGLKILDLSRTAIECLPNSVTNVVGLTSLLLKNCQRLNRVPSLKKLRELKRLDLSRAPLKNIPHGMKYLSNLSYLRMNGCGEKKFPVGILPKLSRLQVFILEEWTIQHCRMGMEREIYAPVTVEGKEVGCLRKLESLQCHFEDQPNYVVYLKYRDKTQSVRSYKIVVGQLREDEARELMYSDRGNKVVVLGNLNINRDGDFLVISNDIQQLICKCTNVGSLGDVLPLKYAAGLEFISIKDCKGMESLVSSSWFCSAPVPQPSPSYNGVFSGLKEFCCSGCKSMKKLLPLVLLPYLVNLERIEVSICEKMEEIIGGTTSDEEGVMGEESISSEFKLPKLRQLILRRLPVLKSICRAKLICNSLLRINVSYCNSMEILVPSTWVCPINLERIEVSDCEKMEEIIGGTRSNEEGVMGEERISSKFKPRKLRELILRRLPGLKSICSKELLCDSLEEIEVILCEKLKRMPICLPLLVNGKPSPPRSLKRITICPEEWWESEVEWEHPNAKDVLRPFVQIQEPTFRLKSFITIPRPEQVQNLKRATSPQRPLTNQADEPQGVSSPPKNQLCLRLGSYYDQLCSPSVKNDVIMDDVQSVVKEKTEPIASMLEQSNAILDKLAGDDGRIQVGVQGLEQGAEKKLICLHPEAESGMKNTCAEYIQHVDINESLEQTRLMESTSGRLMQPGTCASSTKLVGRAYVKNAIWSCLMDDKVSIIGIYGMGGNGKTTMLRNICNELLERQDISHSIYWVNVPQDFRIDRSQDLIAKRLDLNLPSKDDDLCGVVELAKELMMKQKWILILNDLWNSFDPQQLGIPIPLNGSKFIMTTRSEMVCQQMNCQNSIRVDRLSDEEAWTLLMEKLGHDRQLSEEEKRIAVDVARECDGLPLGIVTLAESLKGVDDLHKWKITLKRLKESNFWDMEDQIFQILRLSYDCLDDSAKQCFVYCALFDESQKIERGVLIESFIEEGIIREFDKGHSILDGLENVCLLERIDGGSAVKMHDLLRDMAIQILDDEYSLDMRAKEERG